MNNRIVNKLKKEITKMAKSDQKMRRGALYDPKIDKDNTKKLKEIIKKYGWPKISTVGKFVARDTWLIAQHADHDIQFQSYCLELLKKSAEENEAQKKYVAYLTDRILVNRNKPQLFGTQFHLNKKSLMVPRKIKNPKELNKRRKLFKLGKFEDYQKKIIELNKKLR